MAKGKQVLGKGLDILFAGSAKEEPVSIKEGVEEVTSGVGESILFIEVDKIKTNPYQPREEFDEVTLKELADSIKQKGVIQPITVRKISENNYELLSGERRLRAAKMVKLDKIPSYILDLSSKEDLLEISLIENIQRKDLNPIEIAHGVYRLITECGLTQEDVSERVGKSRTAVTNYLRLLKLPEEIRKSIRKNEISEGHARAILAIDDPAEQLNLWKRIIGESLTVRRSVDISKKMSKPKEKIFNATNRDRSAIDFLESKFREHFGTKVRLVPKTKTSGEIIIEYYTSEDLERIIDLCKKR
jgi:ParB family chromosome partitioning protein